MAKLNAPISDEMLVELDSLAREKGTITPADVVDRARSKLNPLHPSYEWRDKIAGELYREDQARLMLRSVKVPREELPETTQVIPRTNAFVPDPEKPEGYMLNEVLKEDSCKHNMSLLSDLGRCLGHVRRVFANATLYGEHDTAELARQAEAILSKARDGVEARISVPS